MGKKLKIRSNDTIVHDVIRKFDSRSAKGLETYGKPLSEDHDSIYRWFNDVQEELMDAILYIEKVKQVSQELLEEKLLNDYMTERRMYPGDITRTEYHVDVDEFWKQNNT